MDLETLTAWFLAAMTSLAPARDHTVLATASAERLMQRNPPTTEVALRAASLEVAVFFRESTFDNDAIGDDGNSHCAGQIHLPYDGKTAEGWSGAELRADPVKCVTVTDRMLFASLRACAHLPRSERVSLYARGSCTSEKGRAISRDRSWVADELVRTIPVPIVVVEIDPADVAFIRSEPELEGLERKR